MEGLRMKMLSVGGAGSMEGLRMKRPSVASDGDMEALWIKRPSLAGDLDDDMEGLRFKRPLASVWFNSPSPSVAGDGAMEGLRIKRPRPSVACDGRMCSVDILPPRKEEKEEETKKVVDELQVVDAGSSKEKKGGKRTPPSMEPYLFYELTDYMLYEPERIGSSKLDVDLVFPRDPDLAAEVKASLKKSEQILADRLRQFRLNGYATVSPSWELTSDEKEE